MRTFHKHGHTVKFKHAQTVNHGLKTEKKVINQVLNDLPEDGTFLDVGACHGLYSCIVGKVRPDVTVWALEPHPANHNRLLENMEVNDLSFNTPQIALSDENDILEFTSGKGPGVHRLSFRDDLDTIEVNTHKLDDYIHTNDDIPVPNVIKIDVEGAEYQVLQGAINTIRKEEVKSILIEMHLDTPKGSSIENYRGSEGGVVTTLTDAGYDVEKITQRKNTYHIHAHR